MSTGNVGKRPLSAFEAAKARKLRKALTEQPQEDGSNTNSISETIHGREHTLANNEDHSDPKISSRSQDLRSQAQELVSNLSEGYNLRTVHSETPAYTTDVSPDESGGDSEEEGPSSVFWEFSTWRPSDNNVLSRRRDCLSIRLNVKETVALIGMYRLTVKKGAVSIRGALLRAGQSYPVAAPSTESIPVIQGLPPNGADLDVACVAIGTLELRRISALFENIWAINTSEGTNISKERYDTFSLLQDSRSDSSRAFMAPISIPAEWDGFLRSFDGRGKNQTILVAGPNGSGKSTLCSLISNRFMSKSDGVVPQTIFWLDLNYRNPCYTLPGTIALVQISDVLLGPINGGSVLEKGTGYNIILSHPISVSCHNEHQFYFAKSVSGLLSYFKETYRKESMSHLLIDAPNFTTASELEAFIKLVDWKGTSDIIYMSQDASPNVTNLLSNAKEKLSARLSFLPRQPKLNREKAPSELNDMRLISYFHAEKDHLGGLKWNNVPLSFAPPIMVEYSGPNPGIAGVVFLGEVADPLFYPSILEGSLVYIATILDDQFLNKFRAAPRHFSNSIPALPFYEGDYENVVEPQLINILCIGLMREVNTKTHTFYLIVPHLQEHLLTELDPNKTVLVHGCAETPGWAFIEDCHYNDYVLNSEAHDYSAKSLTNDINFTKDADLSKKDPPWTMRSKDLQQWGGINAIRRFRKFNR